MDEIISYKMCAVKVCKAKLRNYLKLMNFFKKDLSINYVNQSEFCVVWTTRISFLDGLSAVPPFLLRRDCSQSTCNITLLYIDINT